MSLRARRDSFSQAESLSRFDQSLRERHRILRLAGVDEAGRGPLAGPVVAAAVVMPPGDLAVLPGVRDSKRLTPVQREALFDRIRRAALAVGVGWAAPARIDAVNILQATFEAMRDALRRLPPGLVPERVVVDGNMTIPGVALPQEAVVGGDDRSLCVASASIVAKVVRDRWMRVLDRAYPGYGFESHKGYGTSAHLAALAGLGPSPVHRRSFRYAK